MTTKKKPCGNEYKKRRLEKQEADSKLPKITGFCKRIKLGEPEVKLDTKKCNAENSLDSSFIENKTINPTNQPELDDLNESVQNEKLECSATLHNQTVKEVSEISEKSSDVNPTMKNETITPTLQNDPLDPNQSEDGEKCDFLKTLACEKFPTDRGHYGPDLHLSAEVKKFILTNGPCRPKGNFPKNKNNVSFSDSYYFLKTEAGLDLPREWLCYSPKLDKSYCEACWLFGDKFNPTWANGFDTWSHLKQGIKRHEISLQHMEAVKVHAAWKKGETIDKDREKQIRKETKKMRKILERVLKVVLFLAEQNLAFRGDIEKCGSGEILGGNFLSVIKLLAEYDNELKELIEMKKGSHKYLSPTIQNELIELLASKVKNILLDDIKDAPFFSIVLDTTPDITRVDQLSFVFRYIKIVYDSDKKPVDLQVKESFIEFQPVDDHTAGGLEAMVISFLENNGIDFSKCRGQAYDGASVMSGAYTGLQARLQKLEKNAKYVHCAAHNLNLVLNDAVNGVKGASDFFKDLGELHNFFSASVKRWNELKSKGRITAAVKRLCPTRWSSRDDALESLHNHHPDIMRALTEIILKGSGKEKAEAEGFKKKLGDLNFILMLVTFHSVFKFIGPLSKDLQNKSIDMLYAENRLNDACLYIKDLRQRFCQIKRSALEKAKLWGVTSEFKQNRLSKVPRRLGELSQDERIEDPEKRFEVECFNPLMDIISARLDERFKSFKNVVSKFNVLNPKVLQKADDAEIIKLSEILCEEYKDDLDSSSFPNEMISFRKIMRDEIKTAKNIRDLAKSFICGPSSLTSSFQGVVDAYVLFITLPVTSATNERTFSKLKLIKSYNRSLCLKRDLQDSPF